MQKQVIVRPVVILTYGFPGSGKSYFGRQFADEVSIAYISSDYLRHEFFENPTYSNKENSIINHLTVYMLENFLKAGVSVIYDCANDKLNARKMVSTIAKANKAESIIVWLQIDVESCFSRIVNRDHRKIDDKYSEKLDRSSFDNRIVKMQNPGESENFVVMSGKHVFSTQKRALYKKMLENNLLDQSYALNNVAKPELINLVPNSMNGRVDNNRRNINIY
jgi:predicted kinase